VKHKAIENAVGCLYEAAIGEVPWDAAGTALRQVVGANTVSLWVGDPDAGQVDMLCTTAVPDPAWAARVYAERYYALDIWTVEGVRRLRGGKPPTACLGHDLVPEAVYRRSEFYQDFARHLGVYQLVAGCVPLGGGSVAPLGLHRPEDARAFDDSDRQALQTLLPHLRRALQLRQRIGTRMDARLSVASLDALPTAMVVVEGDARILLTNRAAEKVLADGAAIHASRAGPGLGTVRRLVARNRDCDGDLQRTVRAVARAGAEGAGMLLRGEGPGSAISALVTRLPAPLSPAIPGGRCTGAALVILHEPGHRRAPQARLVAGMLGITLTEAEVAIALAGGRTAEAVAGGRGVSVSTIRMQVRSVLEKLALANLRDLERVLASLPRAHHDRT